MKLQWGPNYEMGRVSTNDERADFGISAVLFANGVQCVGATFEMGVTYVTMDEVTGHVRFFVIPEGGPAPDELWEGKSRYVRADLLLGTFLEMAGPWDQVVKGDSDV